MMRVDYRHNSSRRPGGAGSRFYPFVPQRSADSSNEKNVRTLSKSVTGQAASEVKIFLILR